MYFAFKLFYLFFNEMYSVSVKCLIFTLIINFYLFFGQNRGGKKLTIDKNNISKANKI
jgi:hypothetical protein